MQEPQSSDSQSRERSVGECALIRRTDVGLRRAASVASSCPMAIYHFSAKVISRARGSSAVAAAAYRSASRLEDERLGRAHDFTNKAGVIHSEVLAPEGAPERWQDRATLWNEVEAIEVRKDAQLAREIEFSIPREMERADGVALARDFVSQEFVDRGMVADLNVHWDHAEDGSPKPHAHVMLSMREVVPDGPGAPGAFGKKVREWNATSELEGWRERWSEHVNTRLAELGIEARIDHRTLRDQGIELEPQHKIGPAGMRREERGEDAERAVEHREIARRNGERIIAEPSVALDAITRQQSTFTQRDLQAFVFRHTDDKDQFDRAVSAVRASPDVVALGQDGRGRERFTTREMLGVEARLERSAESMAERSGHEVSAATRASSIAAAERRELHLGREQRDAFEHVVAGGDLAMTVGYAGTGKSAMLGVAREAWEASGYQVRGAALSGIAAENLEAGSGIQSRTIASLEHAWGQGREALTSRDVLVIDEAGMIGSRQMDRVLAAADKAGAKVVMIGDPEQLQAIEAGAAFRALSERHGAAEITQVRRQREDWQRDATRQLATGRTSAALDQYEAAGMVVGHATHQEARTALVEGWDAQRRAAPEESRVILAHTRADVAELNQLARGRMREAGELGEDQAVSTERGRREFASGRPGHVPAQRTLDGGEKRHVGDDRGDRVRAAAGAAGRAGAAAGGLRGEGLRRPRSRLRLHHPQGAGRDGGSGARAGHARAGSTCGLCGAHPAPGRGRAALRRGSLRRSGGTGQDSRPGAGEGHHAGLPQSLRRAAGVRGSGAGAAAKGACARHVRWAEARAGSISRGRSRAAGGHAQAQRL